MSTFQTKAYLIRGAIRFPDVDYPNEQWGYGALDLFGAYNALR